MARNRSATTSRSPNGKWRPSKRSHIQRPPTPSIRLHDETGCHNDPASALPANRPMMSTISNTFADYNIDLEEEEESTVTNSSTEHEEGDGEAYVIQVKPLPKIRLDLCPAPREEDEYRDQNRHRKKKSRRRSSANKSSPTNKSKEGKGEGLSDTETTVALDSSFASTTVTDKAGNDGDGLDATKATEELSLQRQNEQHSPRPLAEKKTEHAQKFVPVDSTMVDADGFPVVVGLRDEQDNNESSTKKDESSKLAPMVAPSPLPALALHQGTASHPSGVGSSAGYAGSGSVAPSVQRANTKEEEANARFEKVRTPPSPNSITDTASITPKIHHRKNRQNHHLEARQTSPLSRKEARQDDRSRRRRSKSKCDKEAGED